MIAPENLSPKRPPAHYSRIPNIAVSELRPETIFETPRARRIHGVHSATKESPIQSLIEAVHDVKAVV